MAINKVVFGEQTLLDVTESTVTSESMVRGIKALGANGEMLTGVLDVAPIYNGLDQVDPGYALDARQGKALNDKKLDINYGSLSQLSTDLASGDKLLINRTNNTYIVDYDDLSSNIISEISPEDIGALPSSTVIPTKVSDLTNDSGFITSYTETDPTVPSWAKAATKPSYSASEVGALPINGGTMTGKITFNKVNNAIAYTGTKASYDMIKFLDNTSDTAGNGISIGGGGAVVIGGGESAETAVAQVGGGNEILYLCNDGDVTILSNMQNGWDSRKTFTFGANGTLTAPAFSGPLTGNVTGNCSGSSGSCTGNAATATRASSASGLWTRTSLTKGTNPSSTQWTGPTIFTYQTGTGTAVADRIAGGIESSIDANGLSTLNLLAYRFASGSTASNCFQIRCAKDGTASYTVTNQGAFRNAIGASSGTWPIGVGGTGATTAAGARTNLGFAVKKVSGTTNSYGNISLSLDATRYAIIYCRSSGGYMAEGFASSDGKLWAHVSNYSTYQANKSVTIWALYIDMGTNGMNT